MKKTAINISLVAIAAIGSLALTGCGEDKPSDKLASEHVLKYAKSGLTGLEVANFQRSNGMVDPDSANRYKVTYEFDWRLTIPLAEAVLANAKQLQNEAIEISKRETGGFLDTTKLQNAFQSMQSTMVAKQWIKSQGEAFETRRDSFIGACAPCVDYWNSQDAPKETQDRRVSFVISWMYFEEIGFKDYFKVGDGVPRHAWASFNKTEKGWQAAN